MTLIKAEKILVFNDLSISLSDVYLAMGCDMSLSNSSLEDEVNDILSQISSFIRPRFSYFSIPGHLSLSSSLLQVADQSFSIGKIIAHQLKQSECFVFFVATAGAEFEEWQQNLSIKNDMLKSFIADAIGSVIAEKTADAMEKDLEVNILDTFKHTNRFSPGYCGWHVSEQQKLFSLFSDGNPCGISLTDSSLMLPIKSVSGVIGVGREVRKLDYSCGLCSFANCFRSKQL